MREWIEDEISKYYLRHRVDGHGGTWEFWQGVREIALVRYKTASEHCDFRGEWLGWDHVLKLYCEVEIPAQVNIDGHTLEPSEANDLAARLHLALCSMKVRHAVVRKVPWPPLRESERDSALLEFAAWMERRGWKVTASRKAEKISIKPKRLRVFRDDETAADVLERGAWVAKAFHALLYKEVDRTVLYVSDGTRQTTNWFAELNW